MPAEDEGKPGQKDSMSKKGKCDVQAKGEEILGEQGKGQGGLRCHSALTQEAGTRVQESASEFETRAFCHWVSAITGGG